jgi:pyrimidine deaminase RibD-like protein
MEWVSRRAKHECQALHTNTPCHARSWQQHCCARRPEHSPARVVVAVVDCAGVSVSLTVSTTAQLQKSGQRSAGRLAQGPSTSPGRL